MITRCLMGVAVLAAWFRVWEARVTSLASTGLVSGPKVMDAIKAVARICRIAHSVHRMGALLSTFLQSPCQSAVTLTSTDHELMFGDARKSTKSRRLKTREPERVGTWCC